MPEYTCAVCHETFEYGWTDDEATAEKEQLWGNVPIEECEIVCDDCFQRIMPVCPVVEDI